MKYTLPGNLLLFVCLFLLGALAAQAQSGQVRGVVIDADGEPLPGATIFIPSANLGSYANDEGIFSINRLYPGTYTIVAVYVGYDTLRQEFTLPRDLKSVNVKLVLSEKQIFTEEVTITAQRAGKIETKKVEVGNVEITPQEINLLPSIGAPDLMQYLQVLPGIVFTGDQGGQLYIRGGTPIQNMTLLDGMIVYSPFHSIGLFSVFDPDYIRSTDVYSAGFPAQYGGRISSIIDVRTRNGSFTGLHGKLNVNPFSTNVLLEGPFSRSRRPGGGSSFLLSFRNNYIDQTSNLFYPYVGDTLGLPYNFTDIYGKVSLSDGVNFANFFGFRHEDNVNYGIQAADIGWTAAGGGANFMLLPQGAGAIISGNLAISNYNIGLNTASETFPRTSKVNGFNGGLDVSYIVNSVDEVKAGIVFLGFQTDYTFTNSFGLITQAKASNSELAVYGNYKKVIRTRTSYAAATRPDSIWDLMVIEPSVRVHYFNDQAHLAFEPRLRMKLNLPRLSFSFATGLYTQNLMSAASDRDVVNFFQGILSAPTSLANRTKDHNLQTAYHLVGGVEAEIVQYLSTTVEVWMKDFTQLTNINRDKVFPEDPNFITETGLAYGADLVLKYQTPNWYLYGTYGWAKVTRNDLKRTYPPVFDRRHTINLVASYQAKPFGYIQEGDRKVAPKFKDHIWELSLRWTMGSGFPFTQTQGYFEKLTFLDDGAQTDISTQNGQLGLLLAEELNGGRLPYYHRLDLSAKRRWLINNTWLLELNLALINAYDRDNIFYFDRIQFQPIYQLPVLPVLGLTVKY